MGLDIYFYKAKNKKLVEEWFDAGERRDAYTNYLCGIYEKEINEGYNKWSKWYDSLSQEQRDDPCICIRGPSYNVRKFITDEEEEELDKLDKEVLNLGQEIFPETNGGELGPDIDDLYMRKVNWMVSFIERTNPHRMTIDEQYGVILKDGRACIDKKDIGNLINALSSVSRATETMEGDELDKFCEETLPTKGGFFFGDTKYGTGYFCSVKTYLEEFMKYYSNMSEDDCLIYVESW